MSQLSVMELQETILGTAASLSRLEKEREVLNNTIAILQQDKNVTESKLITLEKKHKRLKKNYSTLKEKCSTLEERCAILVHQPPMSRPRAPPRMCGLQ